jgi:hypothetical protein
MELYASCKCIKTVAPAWSGTLQDTSLWASGLESLTSFNTHALICLWYFVSACS